MSSSEFYATCIVVYFISIMHKKSKNIRENIIVRKFIQHKLFFGKQILDPESIIILIINYINYQSAILLVKLSTK